VSTFTFDRQTVSDIFHSNYISHLQLEQLEEENMGVNTVLTREMLDVESKPRVAAPATAQQGC
jgi:hypothetical protein